MRSRRSLDAVAPASSKSEITAAMPGRRDPLTGKRAEAHEREIRGHAQAELLRGGQHRLRDEIAAAHEGGRRLGERQEGERPLGGLRRGEVEFGHERRIGGHPRFGERPREERRDDRGGTANPGRRR